MSMAEHVSTSFVTRGHEVLLLHRSDKVSTFQRKWASVSGSLEDGEEPLECAIREIREETGLVFNDHVRLIRSGRPMKVVAPEYKREYIVHVFLFFLVQDAPIQLDWEHTEHRFITVDEMLDLSATGIDTVPLLDEGFRRVWVPECATRDLLYKISHDTVSGAAELANLALRGLRDCVESRHPLVSLEDHLRNLSWHFNECRPTMGSIGNVVSQCVASFLQEKCSDFASHVDSHIDQREKTANMVTEAFIEAVSEHLGSSHHNVFTLTYSSTVLDSLIRLPDLEFVVVAESMPNCEGKDFASRLSKKRHDITVKVCTDAGMLSAARAFRINMCVCGADSVLPDGSFVNKTGTALMALMCEHLQIPLFVLSDTSKIVNHPSEESTSFSELFELVPHLSFQHVITEKGELSANLLARDAERMKSCQDRIWNI